MMFSNQCGHKNRPNARFCVSCGTDLSGLTTNEPTGIPFLNLAGFLRQTAQLYRESFWPFVFISVPPQLLTIVMAITGPIGVAMVVVGLFLSILASAATVRAVASKRLGRPIYVGECYGHACKRTIVLTTASLLYGIALFGAGILTGVLFRINPIFISFGIPIFIYVAIVWFFADEAIMIEGMGLGALNRSADLVSGNWWRVFGIGVVYVIILLGAMVVASLVTNGVHAISPLLASTMAAAIGTLLTPLILIGRTLVYLDLRARKEDFALEILSEELSIGTK